MKCTKWDDKEEDNPATLDIHAMKENSLKENSLTIYFLTESAYPVVQPARSLGKCTSLAILRISTPLPESVGMRSRMTL